VCSSKTPSQPSASLAYANWSVLAGEGSVAASGLFTAPTNPAQAGPVPVSAAAGAVSGATSVGVTGAFPGVVSRTYDYMNFGYNSAGNGEYSFLGIAR
jgi:hypothetical protein